MFSSRSTQTELLDDLSLSGEALRRNLEELEQINSWLGGYQVVTSALEKLSLEAGSTPITVADLGCGGGDTLRHIARWAKKRNIALNLVGYDANAFVVSYATVRCRHFNNITIYQENIFAPGFRSLQFDVVICSLFCHHFPCQELIGLLSQLHSQTRKALIINDLHRHPLAYYGIKLLTRLFPCSHLVRHDAPLSVKRAFSRSELQFYLQKAGLQHYSLRWVWAFRWQIIVPT